MIQVIKYNNKDYEKERELIIGNSYKEARRLLPNLPDLINIYFADGKTMPELSGVGGYAYSKDTISITLDPHFEDKEKQINFLRQTIFHESLHIYQNYTGQGKKYPPIETAIYEGMATVFERDYANADPPYGDYASMSSNKLKNWINELEKISVDNYSDELHSEWAFFHNEKGERWIIYRLGTWIVDEVLNYYNLSLLDIKDKSAKEVLELYKKFSTPNQPSLI